MLGTDEWGSWLLIPAGEIRFFLDSSVMGSGPFLCLGTPILVLAGPGNWWVASFCDALWKVDVTGPVRIGPGSVEWEDLRLDVERIPGHPARITDLDEYEELDLDPQVDARARDVAEWALGEINRATGPFGSPYERWAEALDPRVDRTALHGSVLKLQHWDEPAAVARYGAGLIARWRRRQEIGEGLVLIARAFERIVGLAWAPHPDRAGPAARIIRCDDEVVASSLHRRLEVASRTWGVFAVEEPA